MDKIMDTTFRGAARRLDDLDLPKLGALIGVGEDEIHAFLDVEISGYGFHAHGRPIIRIRRGILAARLRPIVATGL
ncbi:hypothetical protein NKH73_25245 [Mesorhizobium sp. M0938]|uniref:hypothetical protein n=1 Tax=unclassified Mesorhizobium TaxID=325217 RepID=UPI003336FC61